MEERRVNNDEWDQVKLRQILGEHFDVEELHTLCFDLKNKYSDLKVDYDSLPGVGKKSKARALVEHLDRRPYGISKLVKIGQEQRPDISWDDLIQEGVVQLYEQAQEAFQKRQWKEVEQLCTEIEGLAPEYRDVSQLRAKAKAEAAKEVATEEDITQKALSPTPTLPKREPSTRARLLKWGGVLGGLAALVLVMIILSSDGPKPSPTAPSPTEHPIPLTPTLTDVITTTDSFTLTIESHHDGDLVDHTEEMTGTYRNLDPGWHLWSIVQSESGDYWPQDSFVPQQFPGEWRFGAWFGYTGTRSIGEHFNYLVLAVEEGSDAEKVVRNAQDKGSFISVLPDQAYISTPITLTRGSPTNRWLADFWANDAWKGEPVATHEITTTYLFQEWSSAPFDELAQAGWTARFVRRVHFPEDGEYCLYWVRDDTANVFVDGEELSISKNEEGWLHPESACRELQTGNHDVRVDFAKLESGRGSVEFWYDGPGIESPVGSLSGDWQAIFFSTADLNGKPVWITSLPGPFLNFQPTAGGEAPVVNFGAVFSHTLALTEAGTYQFKVDMDDGARFYIDGELVLDEWHFGPTTYTVEKYFDAGDHTLRVEYYEYHTDQYINLTWIKVPNPIPPVERILFASNRDGDYDIYVMDANGANPVNLTDNAHWDYDPAWSPDGRQVIFVSNRDGDNAIYVMDADGTDVNRIGAGIQPRWSPDGSRIAFVLRSEGEETIYVMDANGENVVPLTDSQAGDYLPDWSPDGSRIVFETNRDGNQEIYAMDADGSNLVNLSRSPDSWDATPTWSPDGRFVAFLSNREGNDRIHLMDADGNNQRWLINHALVNRFPDWSPDGRHLIFEASDQIDSEVQIYRADVLGDGLPIQLTNSNGKHERPQWSPPSYGYTFENLTDGDAVNQGTIAVTGDYVWTGGSGGIVRWNRDDPDQQRKFTSESGLAENNVKAILAINETTLWFGTGESFFDGSGLSRYEFGEGREHWRTFTAGDGLGVDTIFSLYQDSQGRIWAGTKGAGPRVYDGQRWRGFDEARNDQIYCVYESTNNVFWFCTLGVGITRYDPSASSGAAWQRFNLMDLLSSDDHGYNYSTAIVEDVSGELWVSTNAGVVYYDGETWRTAGGALDIWTSSAVRDAEGVLWFSTNNGLVRHNPDGQQRTYTAADGLTGIIHALFVDDAGVLWAAGGGLNRYDRENDRWQGYHAHDGQMHNNIGFILQDVSGSFWFGHTWPGGVSRYAPGSDDTWQSFGTKDGLSADTVHVIYQDRDGTIWFGFDQAGGVCRYDADNGEWLPCYRTDPNGLASDEVDSIVQTCDGALWFGTSGGGLSRFDGERWETFTRADSGLLSDQVHCLAEDDEGALWITTDQEVYRFFYETGEWIPFNTRNSDLIANKVLAVALDGNGGIWFGTKEGLSHYDIVTREWRNVEGAPALAGWVTNCSQALHVDRYGTLWVGADEGLYRSTPEGGWLRLTTANGLASNHVLAVFEDVDGVLWIGTPSGLSRLSVDEYLTLQ